MTISFVYYTLGIQLLYLFSFSFNDTATTEIYTLSLHDALPISEARRGCRSRQPGARHRAGRRCHLLDLPRPVRSGVRPPAGRDRKSTRLNSSRSSIS